MERSLGLKHASEGVCVHTMDMGSLLGIGTY
jgi:hypothetical protein